MTALPRPRRVLVLNRVGHLGGVERVILLLSRGLGMHGYEPILACPDAVGELATAARRNGLPVMPVHFDRMRITANPLSLARYLLRWRHCAREVERICRETGAAIIHVHHPVGALYAASAARRLGLPLVLHVHESLPARPLYGFALRRAARCCAGLISVSSAGHALLRAVRVTGPAATVANGTDLAASGAAPPETAEMLQGNGPHIGVFGVIEPRKGQDVFLQAAAQLVERHPTAHFWIVGGLALQDKRGYAEALHAAAEDPRLIGRVTFTGFRSDVACWLQGMDVVVQASKYHESLSMVVLEAMALGRRVVATKIGGTADAITDGHTGLLVPPGDASALAGAIDHALGPEGARLAAAAYGEARHRFSPERMCQGVAEVFDRILDAKAHGL